MKVAKHSIGAEFWKQTSGKGSVTESVCVGWSVYSASQRRMVVNTSLGMDTKESWKKRKQTKFY